MVGGIHCRLLPCQCRPLADTTRTSTSTRASTDAATDTSTDAATDASTNASTEASTNASTHTHALTLAYSVPERTHKQPPRPASGTGSSGTGPR